MPWTEILVALISLAIVGAAAAYIIKAKRSGRACIGCPHAGTCGKGASCAGGCTSDGDATKGGCSCSSCSSCGAHSDHETTTE